MDSRFRFFLVLVALAASTACRERAACEEAVNHMYAVLDADAAANLKTLAQTRKEEMAATLQGHRAALAKDRERALARCATTSMSRENHDCLMSASTVQAAIACGGLK